MRNPVQINSPFGQGRTAGLLALCASLLAWAPANTAAEEAALRLAVQPILPEAQTRRVFQPLADYLGAKTGKRFELVTTTNFLTHWQLFQRENYDLIIDGPHFTDYRVQKMGYRPVAKFPSVVSYSLVASEDRLILDTRDLVAQKVATLPSPGLGALWLNTIFPNPLRQPMIIEADNSVSAVEKLLAGGAAAAMIPTPLVGRYSALVPVLTTGQVPAPGVSVSGSVDPETVGRIREALLEADTDPQGRALLAELRLSGFEPADRHTFDGQADALKGVWGY